MSQFASFMKKNQKQRVNKFYAATQSLCDDKGVPLEWELQPMTTAKDDIIRSECMTVAVAGKRNEVVQKFDSSKYVKKMICACVVCPNLYDKELQESYGVMTPEALLCEMVSDPAEYNALTVFVQEMSGFGTLETEIEEAKN